MGGSSLWLVPPPTIPINHAITTLITTAIPPHFPSSTPPTFAPHITLTSDLPSSFPNAQEWLDALDLPAANEVDVRLRELVVGEEFFKKLTLSVEKIEGLKILAVRCRRALIDVDGKRGGADEDTEAEVEAREWVEEVWGPHCSLLYSEAKISDETRMKMIKEVEKVGIDLGRAGGKGKEGLTGWVGGRIWLVGLGGRTGREKKI
ncbi:MAG: hypothetical protein M1827_006573 [Pycnora praestabilis]|nr:MAG: hypothetical protein M1827_006573 [Pycnora praestabilis]